MCPIFVIDGGFFEVYAKKWFLLLHDFKMYIFQNSVLQLFLSQLMLGYVKYLNK